MVDSCPGSDVIRKWQAGELPLEEAQNLSRHLSGCAVCRELLREQVDAPHRDRPTVQPPDQFTRGGGAGQSDPGWHDDSSSPEKPGQPAPAADRLGFLLPRQSDDELGWLGFFRVFEVLGEGGMGLVLLGEDTRLQRRVALKVMKPEMVSNEVAQKRFLEEVRAVASIKNDHIVTIYHVGKEGDVPFFAMELLAGESLDRRLRREGTLALADALRIARETAEGLAAAHQAGIIHRDIKPSNLWLEGPAGRVKVLDFGLARPDQRAEKLTASGHIMGTPDYMSPEQAAGKSVDARSDLFSLGAVLYEMCVGQTPFDRPSVTAVLTALALENPPPISDFEPSFPEPLVKLVQRLLSKQAGHRPGSAAEVCTELRAIEAALGDAAVARAIRPERPRTMKPVAEARPASDQTLNTSAPNEASKTLTDRPREPARRKSRRRRKSAGKHNTRRRLYVIAGIVLFLALAAPLAFFWFTGPGEVRVVTDNPDVNIALEDHGWRIVLEPAVEQRYMVPPGLYWMKLEGPEAEDYYIAEPPAPLPVRPHSSITIVVRKKGIDWERPPPPPPGGSFKKKGPLFP
ncbi:MAG: serine/threonine-protein kinase [Gemmataceae bacterium]